jgi:spermidine synthase
MIPWNLLGRTTTPGGDQLALMHQPGEFLILAGGKPLMSSRMHGSEEALAEVACRQARALESPTALVGGLGMGFTLRATLDALPAGATVVVAELVAGVVEWNRGPLGHLANHPLQDRRVQVEVTAVDQLLKATKARFDVVQLDVDNGPSAFTTPANGWLYTDSGLAATKRALKDGGTLAVWSAQEDRRFEQRLKHAGFAVTVERVRARLKKGGPRHVIFVGRLSEVRRSSDARMTR